MTIVRRLSCLAVLGALFLVSVPTSSAYMTDAGQAAQTPPASSARIIQTLTSTGQGHQVIRGGGLVYGTIAGGGTIYVTRISPDLKPLVIGSQVHRYALGGGLVMWKVRPGKKSATFRFAGTRFRLQLIGTSQLSGVGVYGNALFVGAGTYSVDGVAPLPWAGTPVDLGTPKSAPAARLR